MLKSVDAASGAGVGSVGFWTKGLQRPARCDPSLAD
jgi:hypothetical protein